MSETQELRRAVAAYIAEDRATRRANERRLRQFEEALQEQNARLAKIEVVINRLAGGGFVLFSLGAIGAALTKLLSLGG